ncbi:MAG: DUF6152 family protein [Steroidobacteraceae bacterium]
MKRAILNQGGAAIVMAAVFGGAVPASAHHSFAIFEPTRTLTFKGNVMTFQWTNPHVILRVLVQPEDGGAPQEWSFETHSPGVLARAGWTRQSIKAGDRVSVTFSPLRDGSHGGDLSSVTLIGTGRTLIPKPGKEGPGRK